MLLGLLGNRAAKEKRKEAAEQATRDYAEKEVRFQMEYDLICATVKADLLTAKKPKQKSQADK